MQERLVAKSNSPVALITGASRGVGAAVAGLLAERGYHIVVNYHSKRSRADAVADTLRAHGVRALPVQADLTRDTSADAVTDPNSSGTTVFVGSTD
jgi:NAD(P)-dependent dehydrogenase (short-subunit alcohol dehydrogenase family)